VCRAIITRFWTNRLLNGTFLKHKRRTKDERRGQAKTLIVARPGFWGRSALAEREMSAGVRRKRSSKGGGYSWEIDRRMKPRVADGTWMLMVEGLPPNADQTGEWPQSVRLGLNHKA
jgi:hypothetical protein